MRKNWKLAEGLQMFSVSVHCPGYKNCHEDLRTLELDDPNCKDCLDNTKEAHRQMEEAKDDK